MQGREAPQLITRTPSSLSLHDRYQQQATNAEIRSRFSMPMLQADYMINRQYLCSLTDRMPVPFSGQASDIRLYQLSRLVLDKEEDINDKLTSIYGAIHSLASTLFVLIHSTGDTVRFYIGVRDPQHDAATSGKVLKQGVEGHFLGSRVESAMPSDQVNALMSSALYLDDPNTCISAVSVVPSERDDNKERYVQGMEKFIDSLRGQKYTALLLCDPVTAPVLEQMRKGLELLYSTIASMAKVTYTYGTSLSQSVADSLSLNFSDTVSEGISHSTSSSTSNGTSAGNSRSTTDFMGSSGWSNGSSYSYTNSLSDSLSSTLSKGTSEGSNVTNTRSNGSTESQTLTLENKSVQDLMAEIDEQLKRMKECEAYGMWECGAYFISDDAQVSTMAASTYRALMCGKMTWGHSAHINHWSRNETHPVTQILSHLRQFRHPEFIVTNPGTQEEVFVRPTQMVSGRELPIFAGLPRHSVSGVAVQKVAAFGREITQQTGASARRKIALGNVLHMGVEEVNNPVWLDMDLLTSHTFITGSTGSGKSNTTYQLIGQLIDEGVPFMVIEPAKGEYKKEFGGLPDLNVFWTNPTGYRQLRINPFRFPEEISVLEHMDQLIEIFNACWPMYAAMPAIFKEGMETIYTRCGWDLNTSLHFDVGRPKYPTFQDLLEVLPGIINASSYSSESKGDYIGALVTRVKSMTTGMMGQVFCCRHDIPEDILFDSYTVIDLSHVGSSETKSLLMGLLIMRLKEYRMVSSSGENAALRHVTIIEEAHNLLKRTSTEQSQESANLAGKSIEMISASIAEMRTYGEGFVIVDQSPTAVDLSAIKNTNTKIVMKLPEKSDIETIGGAFSLDEEQIGQIARLSRGEAIVSQSSWQEPVLCKVKRWNSRFYRGAERENLTLHKTLLGQMLQYLYGNEGCWSQRAFLRLINQSEASQPFKQTCRMMVECFLDDISLSEGNERIRLLAGTGIEWLNCAGLYTVLPLKFSALKISPQSADEFTQWVSRIQRALGSYVVFPDQATEETFLEFYMLYYAPVDPHYQLAYQLATLDHTEGFA